MYLEADVPSRKIIGEDNNRSSFVSSQLLAIGAAVACPIVPLYHRLLPPVPLERDVLLRHRYHHLLPAPSPPKCQKWQLYKALNYLNI